MEPRGPEYFSVDPLMRASWTLTTGLRRQLSCVTFLPIPILDELLHVSLLRLLRIPYPVERSSSGDALAGDAPPCGVAFAAELAALALEHLHKLPGWFTHLSLSTQTSAQAKTIPGSAVQRLRRAPWPPSRHGHWTPCSA